MNIEKLSIGCKGDFKAIHGEPDVDSCNLCLAHKNDHWVVPEGGKLFTVRVESLPRVKALIEAHNGRVAKINRRHKQDIGFAVFTELRTRTRVEARRHGPGVEVFVADIVVMAPRAIISGWEICATLINTEAGYLASRVVNSSLDDIKPFAARGGECDHCKAARRRNTTYVVRETAGARAIKLVGSGCVKDFTGHIDPRHLISYADCLSGLDEELDMIEDEEEPASGRSSGGGRGARATALVTYLAFVRVMLRLYGWKSRGQARDGGGRATADLASEALGDVLHAEEMNAKRVAAGEPTSDWANEILASQYVPQAADHATAGADLKLVEDTLAARPQLDDFETNVQVVVNQGFAFGRNLGIAAYICRFADKVRGDAVKKKQEETRRDEFFGEEKKRGDYKLTIFHVQQTESDWGISYLHIARDAEGRVAKWFSKEELKKGETYEVRATVKKHEVYNGKKDTVLTRVVAELVEKVA